MTGTGQEDRQAPHRGASLFLHLLAPLVPAGHRRRWLEEWRAEIWHADISGRPFGRRLAAALPHAVALRWQESRPEMLAVDLRHAVRQLGHARTFSALVVLTLGIGIGANALVYSILQSTVLNPLGDLDSDGLVYLWRQHESQSMRVSVQIEDLDTWRESIEGLDAIHGVATKMGRLSGTDESSRAMIGLVSPGFFPFLAVDAEIGRLFADEESTEGNHHVIVLGYGLWQERFAGARDAVGDTILVDGVPHTVIGVLPQDLRMQAPHHLVRAWSPLVEGEAPRGAIAMGRLAPGTTVDQVNQEFAALPLEPDGPMSEWRGIAQTPQDLVGDSFRSVVWSFQGAVLLVLLIAGANTANLLLARGSHRRRELSVRAALGAGRGRIVRQLLGESMLLSLAGGLMGLAVAVGGVTLIERLKPADMRYLETLRVDPSVFLITAVLSLGCGLVFGLLPALQVSGRRVAAGLAEGGRTGSDGPRGSRVRSLLVVVEVALSTLLVVGAGLLVASFLRLLGTDPGFDPDDVLTARVSLPEEVYEAPASRADFWQRLQTELGTAIGPRAESVGIASGVPPSVGITFGDFELEEGPAAAPEALEQMSSYSSFTPGVFEALRMPFASGAPTASPDEATSVVINRTLARRLWGDTEAVGRRFRNGGEAWWRVVGVVPDVKSFGLATEFSNQQIFGVLTSADEWRSSLTVVVRASDPLALAPVLRRTIAALEPEAVVGDIALVREMLGESIALQRFNAQLMAAFAAIALGLALVGIYGVLSYSVARRVPELGIRMALGASGGSVLRLIGRQGAALLATGLLVGLLMATLAARVLASQLHGVEPTDPAVYAATALVLVTVGFTACVVPAWRAARVDPLEALRSD